MTREDMKVFVRQVLDEVLAEEREKSRRQTEIEILGQMKTALVSMQEFELAAEVRAAQVRREERLER